MHSDVAPNTPKTDPRFSPPKCTVYYSESSNAHSETSKTRNLRNIETPYIPLIPLKPKIPNQLKTQKRLNLVGFKNMK